MKCPKCKKELAISAEVTAYDDQRVEVDILCENEECNGFSAAAFLGIDDFVEMEL